MSTPHPAIALLLGSLLVALVALPSCKSAEKTAEAKASASASAELSASAIPSAPEIPSASAKKDDTRPVYPSDPGPPDPVAQRLCDALHSLPASRKAACCATVAAPGLEGECGRMLTAALHDGAVTIAAAAVDRCVEESNHAYEGCDWVTPILPSTPSACGGIVQGQLDEGKRCRSSLECKAGLACHGVGPTDAGKCAKPSASGAACFHSADALVAAVRESNEDAHPVCAGPCIHKKCADFKPRGGACNASTQCAWGDHCSEGKCLAGAFAKVGERCDDACEPGAGCIAFTCVKLKGNGESCSSPFECRGSCLKTSDAAPGTCGMKCSSWPPAGYPGGGVGRPPPAIRPKQKG